MSKNFFKGTKTIPLNCNVIVSYLELIWWLLNSHI